MITGFIVNLLATFVGWILSLLPDWSPPSWLTTLGGFAAQVASSLSGSSAFLPWNLLFIAIALVMGTYLVATAVRGFRIVASFLTFGGGGS